MTVLKQGPKKSELWKEGKERIERNIGRDSKRKREPHGTIGEKMKDSP